MWFPVKTVKERISLTGRVHPSDMEAILYASSLASRAGLCQDNQLSYVAFCIKFTTTMINDSLTDIDSDTQELLDNAST